MSPASTRRRYLQLLSGIIASYLASTDKVHLVVLEDTEGVREVLLSLLPEWVRLHAMVSAGTCVLTRQQVIASLRTICSDNSLCQATAMTAGALKRLITEHIHADFVQNRTACIDGWVLSVTEAHLYRLLGNSERPR